MNPKENDIITTIFERKMLKTINDMSVYSYYPIEVVEAKELDFNGIKIIQTKRTNSDYDPDYLNEETKKYEFSYLGDANNSFEKYGYGFSIILNKQSKEDIRKLKTDMAQTMKQIVEKHPLIHVVDNNSSFNKLFINIGQYNYDIDAENYYELVDLLLDIPEKKVGKKIISINVKEKELKKEPTKQITTPEIIVPKSVLYSDEIYNYVSQTVISQDEQIKAIATSLAKNSRITDSSLKQNLIVCGPTGVGKTEIFRTIRDCFHIPMTVEDSSEYTAASFKGKDVTEMLLHLLDNANGDITKAERGIVVVDEIDKKASKNNEHETYTSAVIKSLLPMAEGHTYILNIPGQGEIPFDTSHVTFSFLGAFSGIEEYSDKKRGIGFRTDEDEKASNDVKNIYTDDTLVKYGLLPEFVGRNILVTMNQLGMEDLIRIIKTSNKSQLLLYQKLLDSIGVKFTYDEKTVEAIAKKAFEKQFGARSIKKIVEEALRVADYYVFSKNNYKELIISEETIEDNKQFILK